MSTRSSFQHRTGDLERGSISLRERSPAQPVTSDEEQSRAGQQPPIPRNRLGTYISVNQTQNEQLQIRTKRLNLSRQPSDNPPDGPAQREIPSLPGYAFYRSVKAGCEKLDTAEQRNLNAYIENCDLPIENRMRPYWHNVPVAPDHYQFSIQDVLNDGTCLTIQHHISRCPPKSSVKQWVNDNFQQDLSALQRCATDVQSRLIVVCANQTPPSYDLSDGPHHEVQVLPMYPYQIKLLSSLLPLKPSELWYLVERSPTYMSWANNVAAGYSPEGIEKCSMDAQTRCRLVDLGDRHLIDLGKVQFAQTCPKTFLLVEHKNYNPVGWSPAEPSDTIDRRLWRSEDMMRYRCDPHLPSLPIEPDSSTNKRSHCFACSVFSTRFPRHSREPMVDYIRTILEAEIAVCDSLTEDCTQNMSYFWKTDDYAVTDETVDVSYSLYEPGNIECDWRRLSEARSALNRCMRTLQSHEFCRRHELSGKLGEMLLRAQGSRADIDDTIATLRSILDNLRGRTTLRDARKSIQMSERSIEESKRVKLLTILAFIFIPLSLATSIFGMNIQQITQSGPEWWAVVAVSFALVAVALLGWAFAARLAKAWTSVKPYSLYFSGPYRDYEALGFTRTKMISRKTLWIFKVSWLFICLFFGRRVPLGVGRSDEPEDDDENSSSTSQSTSE